MSTFFCAASNSPMTHRAESAHAPQGFFHQSTPADRVSPSRRRQIPRLAIALLAFIPLAATSAHAAQSAKNPKDSGPVLLSRSGGAGGMWSSVKELEQAAAKGNPTAEAQLGEILLRGDGIAKDERRGVALLEKAARAGNSTAAFRIGMLLMDGESGVAKDPERALAYFRAAAAGGEKEAFFNIGAAYGSAKGVKRDYGEALGWLIVARQRGADPSAENSLRARIQSQKSWIARGERRAKEIEQEFAGKKVTDFLPPPAPLDRPAPAVTPPPASPASDIAPTDALKPSTDLRPSGSLKPAEVPKPTLPTLPPPSVKP